MARPNVFGLIFKVDATEQKKFDQISKKMRGFSKDAEKSLGGSFLNLRNLLIGGGIAAGFQKLMDTGQQFENAEIGFQTFLGSAEAAKKAVAGIAQDAELTPFNFQSLLTANRALVSAGEDSEAARKAVLGLGNAIAASGGGSVELERMAANLQQIKNTGKATAMDIKQFGIAGINIYGVLADYTGKNIDQIKDMEISYNDLVGALQKAQAEGGRFAGALDKAMNSTTGRVSNLGDKIDKNLATAFTKLQPTINAVLELFIKLLDAIEPHLPLIIDLVGILGTAITTYIILRKTIMAGQLAFMAFKAALVLANGSVLLLVKSWLIANAAFLASPIGLVIAGLIALVAVGYLVYKNWDYLVQKAGEFWEWLKKLWNESETLQTVVKTLGIALAIALSPVLIPIAAIIAGFYGMYKAYQWVKSKISGEPIDVNANIPGMGSGGAGGLPGVVGPQSANQGVINSNSTTTNRSQLDVNIGGLPKGSSVNQRGSAPNITVNTGYGASRP